MNVAMRSMNEAWKGGLLEQNGFKCLSSLASHSNKIVYTIGLGKVRMKLMNCLAGSQVVKENRAMGPAT